LLAKLTAFFSARETNAFLVGGYLRDTLLSLPRGHDVDLAVAGNPELLARDLAERLGGTYVPLGPAHGVARVVIPGSLSEPTEQLVSGDLLSASTDGEGPWTIDLAHFPGTIEEDLARRDFTIDALALPLEHWASEAPGEMVIDPFNGLQDLARKCIRAVGPSVFKEDPARLLRAVRFAARLGFRLERETVRLVLAEAHRISQVSGERVRDEFLALLSLDGARGYVEVLDRLDLLCRIIPELAATKGVDQPKEHYWDVWGHLMHSVECAELVTKGHRNSPVYSFVPWTLETEHYFNQPLSDGHTRRTLLKVAALFHDIAKPQTKKKDETGRTRFFGHSELGATMSEARLSQLRFSSRGIAAVSKMVEQHLRPGTMRQGVELPTTRAIYRYFRDLNDVAIDTLYLCLADYLAAKGPELSTEDWAAHARMVGHVLQVGTQPQVSSRTDRLITGHDLMEHLHLVPGPLIGALLDRLDEARAEGAINTRDEGLSLAAEVLKDLRREG